MNTISKEYTEVIRKRIITEFISLNARPPNRAELKELVLSANKKYASIDEVGFSGFDLKRPGYTTTSSAEMETANRKAISLDQEVLVNRLSNLSEALEESFRSFLAAASRNQKKLTRLENRLDSLLLINGQSDVFLNGIQETFDNHQYVDYSQTDAMVADGYATMGRSGYRIVDMTTAQLKHSVIAPQGILSKRISVDIDTLIEDDGKFWEYLLYTDYEEGRVSVVIEIELDGPIYISDLRLSLSSASVSKKMTGNFFVSTDGKVFTPVGAPETPIEDAAFSLNIGLEDVKRIQIILSKDAYDTTTKNGQFLYTFSLDSLKLYTDLYKNLLSTLVCGPYPIVDVEKNSINFSKAKLSACTYEPDGTSIDFYLSNDDGVNWTHSSHDNTGSNIVLFGTSDVGNSIDYIDVLEIAGTLIEASELVDSLNYPTEALLNGFITSAAADSIAIETIVLKRNINIDFDTTTILGAERGWILDPQTKRYRTTIYVDAIEGRTIDFGPKSLFINEREVSGIYTFNQGYSTVQISDVNYNVVESEIDDLTDLKVADPLYPYNHKLLISGYDYAGTFTGEKIYNGLDEFFGIKMKYIAPDYFAFIESTSKDYYNVFTLEEVDGTLYFKVKVNKTDASWSQELFDMTWIRQTTNSNELLVKAFLSSDNKQNSPKLESFFVQVI
jgi:hypothetical protein